MIGATSGTEPFSRNEDNPGMVVFWNMLFKNYNARKHTIVCNFKYCN